MPPELARIVQRGLERDPKLRWSSVSEMIEKLEALPGSRRDVHMNELRGMNHEARVSAQRLSVSSGAEVSGDAPTVAASSNTSNTMTGSSHETGHGARSRRSARWLAAGGVAFSLAALGALFGLRSARERTDALRSAPDPTVAAPTIPSARPSPRPRAMPVNPALELSVVPPEASLSVGGKAISVRDGRALLQGEPGETIEVLAKSSLSEKRFRVFVTRDFTLEPSRIELDTQVARSSAAAKASKEPKQSVRDSKSIAPPARPTVERLEPGVADPKPASKPANPTVRPKDDW